MHVPLKNYEGLYTIHPSGEIRGVKNNNIKATNPNKNTTYLQVNLHKCGKLKMCYLHRLLALQFIPNPNNKSEINHIDGNKQNNTLDNLEWVTHKENSHHAHSIGLYPYTRKFSKTFYVDLLNKFLSGESITNLAIKHKSSLTQFSYWIREAAILEHKESEYKQALYKQKSIRTKKTRKRYKINQLDKNTLEILHTFNSLTSAATALNKKTCGPISNVLSQKQQTAYGYKWEKVYDNGDNKRKSS